MPQKRIAIQSNSGGVGKTTLAVNLAYQLARKKQTVALFGCDPNGSLTLFCGLDDPVPDQTVDYILRPEFAGDYPLFSAWGDRISGIDACLGGLILSETAQRLTMTKRGEYLLADKLEDYPLPHDIIIFDCPGTIEQLHTVTLAASTHILITLKPEDKDIDAVAKLIDWIYRTRQELRLKPAPDILGIVPNGFKDRAMHRDNLGLSNIADIETLPDIMRTMGISMFPKINDSAHIANAAAAGLPLGLFRPGEPANRIYAEIADAVIGG
ncbi:MAG: ParA family protein [Cyanobacteria bacterium Co-bin13]|nr:ParA family protein [Cyanobacteria bacterium Co-bin13]